ncbi:MAG: TetR/AcrR family transcriptional regulator C-terminal domain-containing protein [Hyphomonadaceae bacterium]
MTPDAPVEAEEKLSRGEARRRAFLEAASAVFLEQGYEAASVNEVVRRAGGSLATLYAQFGNKDGLYLAVIEDGVDRFVEPMAKAAEPNRPVADGLQEMGESFLRALVEPDGLAFFRIVIGEGRKFPETMVRFLTLGPDRVRETVAAYLRARAKPDELNINDYEQAANFFCDMIRSRHQYRALAEPGYEIGEPQISAHVEKAVDFFLRALRA